MSNINYAVKETLEAQNSKPTLANVREILRVWKEQGGKVKIGDASKITKKVKEMMK